MFKQSRRLKKGRKKLKELSEYRAMCEKMNIKDLQAEVLVLETETRRDYSNVIYTIFGTSVGTLMKSISSIDIGDVNLEGSFIKKIICNNLFLTIFVVVVLMVLIFFQVKKEIEQPMKCKKYEISKNILEQKKNDNSENAPEETDYKLSGTDNQQVNNKCDAGKEASSDDTGDVKGEDAEPAEVKSEDAEIEQK